MFGLGKKKLRESGLFCGFTDNHSHILPGVDDGIQNVEDSLKVLGKYEELGVNEVWFTPHIMEDTPNQTDVLHRRFEELKTQYCGSIKLHLAAEYMLDSLFVERLAKGDLLYHSTPFKSLLVETSYFSAPMDFYETLAQIKEKGIRPILAHPERYDYMDFSDYAKLIEMGVMFQLNLFSLTGQYRSIVQHKARKLLDRGYYSCVGTDVHRYSQLTTQLELKLPKSLYKELEQIMPVGFDNKASHGTITTNPDLFWAKPE